MSIIKKRHYPHFDQPLTDTAALALASDPARVTRHAFLPFIRYTKVTRRCRPSSESNTSQGKPRRKADPKERPISYAGHADSAVFDFYAHQLQSHYERILSRRSFGAVPIAYRKLERKCNIDFACDAFRFIEENRPCIALCLDITNFFDCLDHALLKRSVEACLETSPLLEDWYKVLRRLTRYSYFDRQELISLFPRDKPRYPCQPYCTPIQFRKMVAPHIKTNKVGYGIPQGSPMSGILANVYMMEFDLALSEFARKHGGYARRYSDDILLILPPRLAEDGIEFVTQAIEERKLEIQHTKTDIVSFGAVGEFSRGLTIERKHDVDPGKEHRQGATDGRGIQSGKLRPLHYLGLSYDGRVTRIRPQILSRYYQRLKAFVWREAILTKNSPERSKVRRRRLNWGYTHRGQRNFISYGQRCVTHSQSQGIRKQLARCHRKVDQWHNEAQSAVDAAKESARY